jgi:hypothetical protein
MAALQEYTRVVVCVGGVLEDAELDLGGKVNRQYISFCESQKLSNYTIKHPSPPPMVSSATKPSVRTSGRPLRS